MAVVALGAVLAILAALASMRPPPSVVWADEGTFLAMAESLARDGDLEFDAGDRARLEAAGGGRASVILQRAEDGRVSYSKPLAYALLAAPFYAVAGSWGLVALNLSAAVVALLLGFLVVRRVERSTSALPGTAALVVASFVGCAVWLPYITWRMADSLQGSLALAGTALVLARLRGPAVGSSADGSSAGARFLARVDQWLDGRAAPLCGGVLLGLLVSMRVNNALLALAPPAALLLHAPMRRLASVSDQRERVVASGSVLRSGAVIAATAIAGVVAALLAVSAVSWATTGVVNPYRAERTSFSAATGYPAGADSARALARFENHLARHHTGVGSVAEAPEVGYSALYFFAGRHTGLLVYFPAALLLLGAALRRPDAVALALVGAFVGAVVFLVGWKPENYFGGETFLGNRYLLPAYAVLLIAPARLPRGRSLAALWGLATVVWASALGSVVATHAIDPSSQSHANRGLFRLLPYESTAQTIDGRRDRYWSGAFVRFVDPYATVGGEAFDLAAGDPPAELLIAHWEPPGALSLRAWSETGGRVRVSDWRREQAWDVPAGGAVDLVFQPSTPWRIHRFWFESKPFWAHALRIEFDASSSDSAAVDGATARVRFLGDPAVVVRAAQREIVPDAAPGVPERVQAGSRSSVELAVRNTSWRNWQRDDVTAVTARWRLVGDDGSEVAASPPIPLPRATVAPHETVVLGLPVAWPTEPGTYTFEADLVLEHVAWFGALVGEPLLAEPVEVVPVEIGTVERASTAAEPSAAP